MRYCKIAIHHGLGKMVCIGFIEQISLWSEHCYSGPILISTLVFSDQFVLEMLIRGHFGLDTAAQMSHWASHCRSNLSLIGECSAIVTLLLIRGQFAGRLLPVP